MDATFRTPDGALLPAVTAQETAAVDRVATGEYDLALLSMMENAGRGLADRSTAGPGGSVVVLAGSGGNGGGGLAGARHLHDRGVDYARPFGDRPSVPLERWRRDPAGRPTPDAAQSSPDTASRLPVSLNSTRARFTSSRRTNSS
jgi:hypothetical protein